MTDSAGDGNDLLDNAGGEGRGPAPGEASSDARPDEAARRGAGGSPVRPLAEAFLVFAAFWLGAWLPADPSAVGAALVKPLYHLALAVDILPKALLLLYLMHRLDSLASFGGVDRPRFADLSRAMTTAVGAILVVGSAAALISLVQPGIKNPLLSSAGRPSASPFALVPAVLLSSLAVGYAEELYFRVYLYRRLQQAGLTTFWAAAGTALLFASGHGLQGGLGIVLGLLIGSWFIWRRLRGANLHELALGHAIYDAVVMLASLYVHHSK
jgi:membrane protease YdiL (CAAX protease family)